MAGSGLTKSRAGEILAGIFSNMHVLVAKAFIQTACRFVGIRSNARSNVCVTRWRVGVDGILSIRPNTHLPALVS